MHVLIGIIWCCFWDHCCLVDCAWWLFYLRPKKMRDFLRLSPEYMWICIFLRTPADPGLLAGKTSCLHCYFCSNTHTIFMMPVKMPPTNAFVSQKQCLSAVINARGNLSQSLLSPSRASDLQVISCLYSPVANPVVGIAQAMVANRSNTWVKAYYSVIFVHLKQHEGPVTNS